MALVLDSCLLVCWAVCERNVPVAKVLKEVNLLLGQQKTSSNRVDWGITPSLVEEATIVVELLEVVNVGLGAEPVQVADLEVGPL